MDHSVAEMQAFLIFNYLFLQVSPSVMIMHYAVYA